MTQETRASSNLLSAFVNFLDGARAKRLSRSSLLAFSILFSMSGSPALASAKSCESLIAPTAAEIFMRLMPKARGVSITDPQELMASNKALRTLGERQGSFPIRTASAQPRTNDRDILLHEPIQTINELGGGWNETLIVTFKNGRKAVFKPFFGQRNLGERPNEWTDNLAFIRESTAGPIVDDFLGNRAAFERGESPIVMPETAEVLISHNGVSYGVGSIQIFVEGMETADALKKRSAADYEKLTESKDWIAFEARTRIIDYILGNPDRLTNPGFALPHFAAANLGNIMVNVDKSKQFRALLIDNAWGRPGYNDFDTRFLPDLKTVPKDMIEALMKFDEAGFRRRFKHALPAAGVEDVIKRVHEVQRFTRNESPSGLQTLQH